MDLPGPAWTCLDRRPFPVPARSERTLVMNVPAKAAVEDATSEALARIVAAAPELMVALGLALPREP